MRIILQYRTTRVLLIVLTILFSGTSTAQEDAIYFDQFWLKCEKSEAKYYRIIEESDSLLKVTDYYIKGGKQSEGFVENTSGNHKILKIRGDFEQKTIGDCSYYKKNGKLEYVVNMQPFHETHGVASKYLNLLDSLDTVGIDLSSLEFETYFFNNTKEFGFMMDEETPHGTWIYVDLNTDVILNRTRYSNGKLDGLSFIYWKNGTVKEVSPYENGKLHGELKKYNKKGILIKGKVFENGILKETWLYQKPKK